MIKTELGVSDYNSNSTAALSRLMGAGAAAAAAAADGCLSRQPANHHSHHNHHQLSPNAITAHGQALRDGKLMMILGAAAITNPAPPNP